MLQDGDLKLLVDKLIEDSKKFYDSIGSINCPAFKEPVVFNADGFHHLLNTKNRHPRPLKEQRVKLSHLKIAVKIIKLATTHQDYQQDRLTRTVFKKKRNGKRKAVVETVAVKYWGLVAIIDRAKVRTVLRKVGNGSLHFYSCSPDWKVRKVSKIKVKEKTTVDLSDA